MTPFKNSPSHSALSPTSVLSNLNQTTRISLLKPTIISLYLWGTTLKSLLLQSLFPRFLVCSIISAVQTRTFQKIKTLSQHWRSKCRGAGNVGMSFFVFNEISCDIPDSLQYHTYAHMGTSIPDPSIHLHFIWIYVRLRNHCISIGNS